MTVRTPQDPKTGRYVHVGCPCYECIGRRKNDYRNAKEMFTSSFAKSKV